MIEVFLWIFLVIVLPNVNLKLSDPDSNFEEISSTARKRILLLLPKK